MAKSSRRCVSRPPRAILVSSRSCFATTPTRERSRGRRAQKPHDNNLRRPAGRSGEGGSMTHRRRRKHRIGRGVRLSAFLGSVLVNLPAAAWAQAEPPPAPPPSAAPAPGWPAPGAPAPEITLAPVIVIGTTPLLGIGT